MSKFFVGEPDITVTNPLVEGTEQESTTRPRRVHFCSSVQSNELKQPRPMGNSPGNGFAGDKEGIHVTAVDIETAAGHVVELDPLAGGEGGGRRQGDATLDGQRRRHRHDSLGVRYGVNMFTLPGNSM